MLVQDVWSRDSTRESLPMRESMQSAPWRAVPWRQYAIIPLAGAILSVGIAVGQYRLSTRDSRMEEIGHALTLRAVEDHNWGRDDDARDLERVHMRAAMESTYRAQADAAEHRARALRLLLCAAFLLALSVWLGRARADEPAADA
ncbi:MAG: hypothetical protein H6713_03055 [Myxococcales bacterium]|nr:hypothetical protein [Myxococcales bacterium]MCB9748967.1 hypothetical protein [Myxococcales bacterium]